MFKVEKVVKTEVELGMPDEMTLVYYHKVAFPQ